MVSIIRRSPLWGCLVGIVLGATLTAGVIVAARAAFVNPANLTITVADPNIGTTLEISKSASSGFGSTAVLAHGSNTVYFQATVNAADTANPRQLHITCEAVKDGVKTNCFSQNHHALTVAQSQVSGKTVGITLTLPANDPQSTSDEVAVTIKGVWQ